MKIAVSTEALKTLWQSYIVNWRDSIALVNSPAMWPQWFKTLVVTRLPNILTMILVLMIAYLAASLAWGTIIPLFWKKTPLSYVAPSTVSVTTPSTEKKADYTFISEQHLFGYVPVIRKEKEVATPEVAPATRLELSLHGVFIYSGPKDGAAIIGESGKNQRYYKTGDMIQKGIELVEVRNDHVLLRRNGRFETLRFPEIIKPGETTKPGSTKPGSSKTAIDVKEYRELFQKHPEKIAEHFDIVPVIDKGLLKGYRVKPRSNRSLYDELGLEPDDLLVAVNGIPLNDRSQLSSAIAEISSAELLTVNLMRNNQQKTLLLDLR